MSRLFILPWIAILSAGCVLKGTHTETVAQNIELSSQLSAVQKERDTLKSQLDESSRQISELEARNEELSNTNQRLVGKNSDYARKAVEDQQEIVRFKQEKTSSEEMVQGLARTEQELSGALKAEIAEGQVRVSREGDRLSVVFPDSVLFRPGSEKIQPAGQKALKKIVPVLRNAKDRKIEVEGYTDAPAKKTPGGTWEVSATKAARVVRFLDEAGLDPGRMSAVGLASGKTHDRRVEIVLSLP
jgi:flagellar motor protein MotB